MNRIVEYVFFFGFMAAVAFLVWKMLQPFLSALALSAIVVTICYPIYKRIVRIMPRNNETVAALVTTLLVITILFVPAFFLTSALVNEALSFYNESTLSVNGLSAQVKQLENNIRVYVPSVQLDTTTYVKQAAAWVAGSVGIIFAGTANTIFAFFIAMIGSFYLFKDGKPFIKQLIALSPLPNEQDEVIMRRLAVAVRSVATGTLFVALIQGMLTGFGLWLFGFHSVVLWGTMAAIGALIPGIGTTVVFVPAVISLIIAESYGSAIGLTIWGMLAVGLIDNLLGPYLMSRGNAMHPFVILIAVLGGIAVFGPIGFIVGPVVVSLFMVLLEFYEQHLSDFKRSLVTEPK